MSTNDLMVDLETLDTKPGAVILSIGAVFFDKETGLHDEFHCVINKDASVVLGLTVSEDTLKWWQRQTVEAQATLNQALRNEGDDPAVAAALFSSFVTRAAKGPSNVRVWGNGSDFDNVLLVAFFERVGLPVLWKFYNHRCYRTLKNLRPDIKLERSGVYHNALDDAKTQALHACRILEAMDEAEEQARHFCAAQAALRG